MSAEKHTPGPWQVRIERFPDGTVNGTPTVYAPNGGERGDGRHICKVYNSRQLDANARLIAESPNMLRVLKWAVTWWNEHQDGNEPEFVEAALIAIAKAEGTV